MVSLVEEFERSGKQSHGSVSRCLIYFLQAKIHLFVGDIVYREWAPNAIDAYLIGEFSKSDRGNDE